jgi:sigma-B regulation protein RsbU (phosphoserine phosphatase)
MEMGDIMVVSSDGLTKAENLRSEVFGEERLREIIERDAPSGGQAIEQGCLKALEEFTQGMPQTDDVTFAIIERNRQP